MLVLRQLQWSLPVACRPDIFSRHVSQTRILLSPPSDTGATLYSFNPTVFPHNSQADPLRALNISSIDMTLYFSGAKLKISNRLFQLKNNQTKILFTPVEYSLSIDLNQQNH